MLIPTFRLTLNNPVLHNLAVIGKFNGKHPSLAAATSTDHILIHSPHTRNTESEHETRQFSVNRRITALASGDLEGNPEKKREILLIGTQTNLLAYDAESNCDIFFKEVPDGVHALLFGNIPSVPSPLAIVGGNCSIQGFNATGTELFWTVTGDNVSALALRDIHRDGRNQLLVGSEDFEIRIFQQEEVVVEATECDVITGLTPIHSTLYGYALANGTIGVYNNNTRVWHAKSKHKVHSINSFDLNGDGVPELVAGWSNGRIEVRHDQTGELIYKDKFTTSIAKVMVADYRMDNKITIVACAVDGEIRGYLPSESSDPQAPDALVDTSVQENTIKALLDRKQELMAELKGYEANLKAGKNGAKTGAGIIPANTKISLSLKPNKSSQALLLTLSTNNDTLIKMAMIFSEIVFDEESKIIHPKQPSTTLSIPIRPDKNIETDLLIKAIVGHKSSTQDHVFEMTHTLPRFASFVYCKPRDITTPPPRSSVIFNTAERVNRVVLWINQSFNIDEKQPISGLNLSVTSDSLHAAFLSIRDGSLLIIKMGPENGGQIQIRTDNMELAGDIVQDMCRYLNITNLESVADFPIEMESFAQVLTKVEEHNSIRLKLSAEIADSSNLVKTLVIKAEDARILNDVPLMTRMYAQLYDLNGELIGEYNKRANNHTELLKSLKDVNHMIQKASRLRMGDAKTKVVNACRKAIKSNNIQSLFKIIKVGNTGN